MALAIAAFNSARTYLNDQNSQIWSNAALLPYLVEAFNDMIESLTLYEVPLIKEKSVVISVPVSTSIPQLLNSMAGFPTDFIEPIKLKERATGSTNPEDFESGRMIECEFLPNLQQQESLRYWCWQQQNVLIIGATTARDVLLYYIGGLSVPIAANSSLGFTYAEHFLGPKTAAYAAGSVGNSTLAQEANQVAQDKLDNLLMIATKNQQNLPARRIPYHRGRRGRSFSQG